MSDKPTGVDRFFCEAAYFAALLIYLIENKSDHETDAEIGDILIHHPFMVNIAIGVMEAWK